MSSGIAPLDGAACWSRKTESQKTLVGAARGSRHVQRKIQPSEAARERGDDWARGPWEDDVDGGADEGNGGEARRYVHGVRPDRQGAGREGAGIHDRDGARGV